MPILMILALSWLTPAIAAVRLASPDEDRQAKQALPPAGKALLYVYRQADEGPPSAPMLWINDRATSELSYRMYFMFTLNPGRVDLRTGDGAGAAISLQCQQGRIYFVQLSVDRSGASRLTSVNYGKGRRDTHQSRLVQDPGRVAETSDSVTAARSGANFIFRAGGISLAHESQSLLSSQIEFSSPAATFAIEGEWIGESGWSVGAELSGQNHGYTGTAPVRGDITVASLMLTTHKYFRPERDVRPYLGAGIGAVAASMSGTIAGDAGGAGMQVVGGVAIRWGSIGLYPEVRYRFARPKDANGVTIDASGYGLLIGIGMVF